MSKEEQLLKEIRRKAKELGIEEAIELEIKGFEESKSIGYLLFLKDYAEALKKKGILALAYHNDYASSFVLYLLGLHPVNPVRYNLDNRLFLKKHFENNSSPFSIVLCVPSMKKIEAIEVLKAMSGIDYAAMDPMMAYIHRFYINKEERSIGIMESPQLAALEKALSEVGLSSYLDIEEEDEDTLRYMLEEDDEGYELPHLSGCLYGSLGGLYDLLEAAKPNSLLDLARLVCLTYGTIEEPKEETLRKAKEEDLDGLFCTKEDIFKTLTDIYDVDEDLASYLSTKGLAQNSLSEADYLALKSHEVKEDILDSIKRIRYFPHLSFGLALVEIAYRLAYMKCHLGLKAEEVWNSPLPSAYVGPFFYIGGKLYACKEKADGFDRNRRYFDVGLSHFLFFDQLGLEGDYGHYPRGRVIYDNFRHRFLVYLDKSLKKKGKEALIIKEFKLEKQRVLFLLDEHYEHDDL